MDQVVSACMAYLKGSKSLSLNTVVSYERDIRQYANYLKSIGISDTHQAGKDILIGYIQSLTALGKSASTISRCIASLRIFYRFLIRNGLVDGNPIIGIETPKIIKKPPKILSSQEVDKLLEVPGNGGVKNLRDKAIIELLYETGLKVSELIALDVENIDFDKSSLSCSEGRKKRDMALRAQGLECLNNYLKRSRPYLLKNSQERSLFINSSGNRISRQGIWKIIKKYTRIAHVETDVSPYTLRHTLTADLIRKGGNTKDVQRILGNATPIMIEKYNTVIGET